MFFPEICAVCDSNLNDREDFICTSCRWEMPLTGYSKIKDNPVFIRMNGIAGVENASAMFYYNKGSGYDGLIHKFKYGGYSRIAYKLGRWFGQELKESSLYQDVDMVIPVPLHPLKILKRGYNQSEYVSRGISKELRVKVKTGNLLRVKYNRSQTTYTEKERWNNVEGIFYLLRPSIFENKHILLVDDVLTTGATLEACVKTIKSKVENCRISIAVLAATSYDTFGKD
ncbi:MAG: ComF family protein [Rikenellaceae bacterium]|nr:ComF family protein [Rikenellaceae bacterium]